MPYVTGSLMRQILIHRISESLQFVSMPSVTGSLMRLLTFREIPTHTILMFQCPP